MKFQNPSLNFFLNGRKDGRTDGRTDEHTSRNQYAPHFFKVGGIKSKINFLDPICYHGNQCSDLAKSQTHPSSHVFYHFLQV